MLDVDERHEARHADEVQRELLPLFRAEGTDDGVDVAVEDGGGTRLRVQLRFAAFGLGHVEDVVDEPQQEFRRGVYLCEAVAGPGRVLLVAGDVGHADDAVERGPDVVAHAREEFGLGFVGRRRLQAQLFFPGEFLLLCVVVFGDVGADDEDGAFVVVEIEVAEFQIDVLIGVLRHVRLDERRVAALPVQPFDDALHGGLMIILLAVFGAGPVFDAVTAQLGVFEQLARQRQDPAVRSGQAVADGDDPALAVGCVDEADDLVVLRGVAQHVFVEFFPGHVHR